MFRNRTINGEITLSGKPLHSSVTSKVILKETNSNNITINNLHLNPIFITNTSGMTTHGNISQIEHLMSGLYAMGINSLDIIVEGNELPILDGCSKYFIDEINKVGVKDIEGYKMVWHPNEEIICRSGDSYIKYEPWNKKETQFICNVDFPYVGKQTYEWTNDNFDDYYDNISNARTFFWDEQFMEEKIKGKCKGVDMKNCIVYGKDAVFKNNELAKHKLLDVIGDLGTLNILVPGKFTCYKPGHKMNNIMAQKLWELYVEKMMPLVKMPCLKIDNNGKSDIYKLSTIRTIFNNQLKDLKFFRFNSDRCSFECSINNMTKSKIHQLKKLGIESKCVDNTLFLPMHQGLNSVDIMYIIDNIKKLDKVDVVLVGCGRMGSKHLVEINNNHLFNLIGIVDPMLSNDNPLKMDSIKEAKNNGATCAIIASSTDSHYKNVLECLSYDMHVLVEKPAFLDKDHYCHIMDIANKNNLTVSVGMVERYNPEIEKLNGLGGIDNLKVTRICLIPSNRDTSHLIDDLLCHDLDILRLKFGDIYINETNKKKNSCIVNGKTDRFSFVIHIGYSKYLNKRKYTINIKNNRKISLDLSNKNHLLFDEHNDWINYLMGNNNKICKLKESLNIFNAMSL